MLVPVVAVVSPPSNVCTHHQQRIGAVLLKRALPLADGINDITRWLHYAVPLYKVDP